MTDSARPASRSTAAELLKMARDCLEGVGRGMEREAGHQELTDRMRELRDLIDANLATPLSEQGTLPITDNDRRWRILEHGCQWISFAPLGGEDHSFDPRGVPGLQAMRKFADEISERHIKMLKEAIEQSRPAERAD